VDRLHVDVLTVRNVSSQEHQATFVAKCRLSLRSSRTGFPVMLVTGRRGQRNTIAPLMPCASALCRRGACTRTGW
jgi:hypothetical protein